MHESPATHRIRRPRPVFIGGCDRSGTTLLGAILGAHRRAVCVPEGKFIVRQYRPPAAGDPFDARAAFERLRSNVRFRFWGLDVEWDAALAQEAGDSFPALIEALVRRYAAQHGKPDAAVWVDHTPSNTLCATRLLDMFPDARFIHLVRDGRAVHASIKPLDWGPNAVTTSAPWWVEKVGYGLAAETTYGPERVLRVRYEDVVLRTDETVCRVADFADLPFDPAMLAAGGFHPPLHTPREHALVGRPPDRSRVEAWKDSMTDREVEIFEALTRDFLSLLGYEPRYGARALHPTTRERFTLAVEDVVGRAVNRLRRDRRYRRARLRLATSGWPRRREHATVSPSS